MPYATHTTIHIASENKPIIAVSSLSGCDCFAISIREGDPGASVVSLLCDNNTIDNMLYELVSAVKQLNQIKYDMEREAAFDADPETAALMELLALNHDQYLATNP